MKIYVVKHNNFVRMLKEEHRNSITQVVHLADALTQERIVMPAEQLRSITINEFEATDDIPTSIRKAMRDEERRLHNDAAEHYNALNWYLSRDVENVPITAALAIIQDFLEQKERELAWE